MKLLLGATVLIAAMLSSAHGASLHDLTVKDIDGRDVKLDVYRGKVLLIVNVASECGYTPQYQGLQALYEKHKADLVVLAFPCNQFGGQEPGTNAEIKEFCTAKFQVTFPVFGKIEVNGKQRDKLYATLAGPESRFPGNIKWNFEKFVVGRDGAVIARFDADVEPDSEPLVRVIESAIARR